MEGAIKNFDLAIRHILKNLITKLLQSDFMPVLKYDEKLTIEGKECEQRMYMFGTNELPYQLGFNWLSEIPENCTEITETVYGNGEQILIGFGRILDSMGRGYMEIVLEKTISPPVDFKHALGIK